jgi:predicted membrane-bound spermidine synthase
MISALSYLLKNAGAFWIYFSFASLFILPGFITGFLFPLGNKLYATTGVTLVEASSKLNSCDHLGAAIGSIIGGIFLIPILGIEFSCLVLAALNIFSIVVIIYPRRVLHDIIN